MDIEGSEADVICHSNKLKKVNEIFIEYHSFVDENQSLGELLSCLSKKVFGITSTLNFAVKNPLLKLNLSLIWIYNLIFLQKEIENIFNSKIHLYLEVVHVNAK